MEDINITIQLIKSIKDKKGKWWFSTSTGDFYTDYVSECLNTISTTTLDSDE